jgi:putative DNA primase/helicase
MSAAEIASLAVARATGEAHWLEPEALTDGLNPEPYPIDALPETLRAAAMEVQAFVKTPISMTACSALSALSIATQAHVDAQRAVKLIGPTSLYMLVVADSGERKSTLDGFFTTPIREWERREADRLKPEVLDYQAKVEIWNSKRDGFKEAIKAATKKGKDPSGIEANVSLLERSKPVAPRVPKVLRVDDTPEALAWLLAKEWPSAAVVSSEAGLVLGSHGMGRETIMRNLAQLNILWDGGTLSIGRRTSESFIVSGARLTVALQIQEPTFRAFFDGSKGLARGTGFLARFLVCWPTSTQGTRWFTEAPTDWPALSAFNRRIEDLLNTPAPADDGGTLNPTILTLSPDAKAVWVKFHDGIEEELREGGDLADVRDVASKTADNAARLAALFHALERGTGGQIQADHMTAAARVAAWHLSEARRFFGEIALPLPIADATRLERFLIEWCRRHGRRSIPRREAQRQGPVRDGSRLDAALAELVDVHRVRTMVDGKRILLAVNPALLTEAAL